MFETCCSIFLSNKCSTWFKKINKVYGIQTFRMLNLTTF